VLGSGPDVVPGIILRARATLGLLGTDGCRQCVLSLNVEEVEPGGGGENEYVHVYVYLYEYEYVFVYIYPYIHTYTQRHM
jgi:hypothetical protein